MSNYDNVEKIPTEQLERARRNACAQIVSLITKMMAETNSNFNQIDKRLGGLPGQTEEYVLSLMRFDAHQMRDLAYIVEALGADLEIGVSRVVPIRPLVNRHIPIEDIEQYAWLFETRAVWDKLDPYTLVEVIDGDTVFHIGPKFSFNEDYVLRWKTTQLFEKHVVDVNEELNTQ